MDVEKFLDDLKNRLDELESERKESERIHELRKKYCTHDWGPVHWTWCCGGYRECMICGAREDYYERD